MKRVVIMIVVALLTVPALAQEFEVGQTVIAIADQSLQTLDGSEAGIFAGVPLKVEEIREATQGDGHEVLVSNGTPGWLNTRFVKRPDEALAWFDQQLTADPANTGWLMARAMTLAATGKHEEAIAVFSQLVEFSPDDPGYLNERAGSYMALGQYDKAVEDFNALIERKPMATLHNNRALCHQAMGSPNSARRDFRRALELDPSLTGVLLSLGKLEARLGNPVQARKYFVQYNEQFPQSIDGHITLAEFCLSQRDLDNALISFERAIRLRPDDQSLLSNRAMVLRDLGQTDEAIEAFSAIIEQFPDQPAGYINRAVLRESTNQPQTALEDFNRALELVPDSAFCHFHRGCVRISLQDFESAIVDLTRAIELEPRSTAFERRGEAYAELGQVESALADFDRALEDDPKRHFARYRRATIYHTQGNTDKALNEYTRLVNSGVRNLEVFYNRSRIFKEQGQWDRAITDLESAIAVQPDSIVALNSLAWALATTPDENQRQPQRATELAHRACELTEWKQGVILDTLAVAQAAAGDFDAAVQTQQRALQMDDAVDNEAMQKRLKLFETGQPFVDGD
ncbi:MAG: tetratricopeptide repeat protein [Pirellulaceae bacterium]